jgi:hypothetical protein
MQNRVSADVASKRLSKLLVESTDIPIPDLAQIPPSLAATQIFPSQNSALFYHSSYCVHVSYYVVTRLQVSPIFVFVSLF